MALQGAFTDPLTGVTIPGAYIRVESIAVEKQANGYRLVVSVAVYASSTAASGGSQPVFRRVVDLNLLPDALAGSLLTAVYTALQSRPEFATLSNAL